MSSAIERRIAGITAALDQLAPPPSEYDRFIAENPWIDWLSTDEMLELEELYRQAEDVGEATPADVERALALMHASKARMLAGEPKDIDLPPVPFDVQLQRSYERNNVEAEKRKRAAELKGR